MFKRVQKCYDMFGSTVRRFSNDVLHKSNQLWLYNDSHQRLTEELVFGPSSAGISASGANDLHSYMTSIAK